MIGALAQTTMPALNPESITEQLGTVSGIVLLALAVVQGLKLLLTKYKVQGVSQIPTPLICVGVSVLLTLLANLVFKTLPGEVYDVVWQAILAAATASGLYTWIIEPLDSPANRSDGRP